MGFTGNNSFRSLSSTRRIGFELAIIRMLNQIQYIYVGHFSLSRRLGTLGLSSQTSTIHLNSKTS